MFCIVFPVKKFSFLLITMRPSRLMTLGDPSSRYKKLNGPWPGRIGHGRHHASAYRHVHGMPGEWRWRCPGPQCSVSWAFTALGQVMVRPEQKLHKNFSFGISGCQRWALKMGWTLEKIAGITKGSWGRFDLFSWGYVCEAYVRNPKWWLQWPESSFKSGPCTFCLFLPSIDFAYIVCVFVCASTVEHIFTCNVLHEAGMAKNW